FDEGKLVLAGVDLSAEESGARAGFAGFFEKSKGIESGTGGAAEDSGDEIGVVGDEFFHGGSAVEGHFEEERPAGGGDAGEGAGDEVVEESADVGGAGMAAGVGIEDFEEVAEVFLLGLDAEL